MGSSSSGSRCSSRTSPRSGSTRSSATGSCASSRSGRSTELVLQEHDVASAPVADVVGRSPQRPPWQRADAAVERQDDARALVGGDGSLVYRSGNGVASILQAAGDADAIRALIESLPEGTTGVRYLNGPEGDPVNAALEALGGTCVARQHEMLLELG